MAKDEAYREAERLIEDARQWGSNFDLNGMNLTEVPETLGKLTQLRVLYLSNNQLTSLPQSLGNLMALEELFLHGNPRLGISQVILGPTLKEVREGKKAANPRDILAFYFRQRSPQGLFGITPHA